MIDQFPEDYDDDYDVESEIIGYECLACGHIQEDDSWGGECEVCTGKCLEPVYE